MGLTKGTLEPDKYIAQSENSCCFVYAVANCLIYFGREVPDIEKAKDIGACRHGSVIDHQGVVDYFNAPLEPTEDKEDVYKNGGIINIMHPIYNGHCFFLFPYAKGFVMINSWLGPNVTTGVGRNEIDQFVKGNLGKFWKLN